MAQEKAVELLQEAISLLSASSKWGDKAALVAHKLGLHGEKRRERHESRADHMLTQYYVHKAYDLFDAELTPAASSVEMPEVTTISDYLEMYIDKSWATYDELNEIANNLVVAGYKSLTEPLYESAARTEKSIIAVKRLLEGYKLSGMDYTYISRYEVSYENVHDDFEKTEASEGWHE